MSKAINGAGNDGAGLIIRNSWRAAQTLAARFSTSFRLNSSRIASLLASGA